MDMEPRLRKGGFEMPAKKKAEVQAEEAVKETKKTAKKPAAKKTAAAEARYGMISSMSPFFSLAALASSTSR